MAKGQKSRKETKKPSAKKKAKTSTLGSSVPGLQTEPVVVGKKVKKDVK